MIENKWRCEYLRRQRISCEKKLSQEGSSLKRHERIKNKLVYMNFKQKSICIKAHPTQKMHLKILREKVQ